MRRPAILAVFCVIGALQYGCGDHAQDGYIPASTISADGFVKDDDQVRALEGLDIRIWGFVDHHNIYGDEGSRDILGEWWNPNEPGSGDWSFRVKAAEGDEVGHSFPVIVLSDAGNDAILEALVADARANRPTRVFLRGRIRTYFAPTNGTTLKGLQLTVQSSEDIRVGAE